jgi:hypothetical protein
VVITVLQRWSPKEVMTNQIISIERYFIKLTLDKYEGLASVTQAYYDRIYNAMRIFTVNVPCPLE